MIARIYRVDELDEEGDPTLSIEFDGIDEAELETRLTGDADYHLTLPALGNQPAYDGLVVTHHGARYEGDLPKAKGGAAPAVVSYGKDNRYKHPHETTLTNHIGWNIERTADHHTGKRGDRTIR